MSKEDEWGEELYKEQYEDEISYIEGEDITEAKDGKVQYKKVNGYDCAFLSTYYFIREGSSYTRTYEDFCLRKDSNGNWKILTWRLSTEDEINGY
jgi:hypothetical protein